MDKFTQDIFNDNQPNRKKSYRSKTRKNKHKDNTTNESINIKQLMDTIEQQIIKRYEMNHPKIPYPNTSSSPKSYSEGYIRRLTEPLFFKNEA